MNMNEVFNRLIEIEFEEEKWVPHINLRFIKTLDDIPKSYTPKNGVFLVIYLKEFDEEMSYLHRY